MFKRIRKLISYIHQLHPISYHIRMLLMNRENIPTENLG